MNAVDAQQGARAAGHSQIVEQSPSRLVLFLAPGFGMRNLVALLAIAGGTVGAGIVWMKIFSAVGTPPSWPAIIVCVLNGLAFAAFLVVMVRIRFTRFHLVIESDRLVLTRFCFGRSRTTEIAVNSYSQASLAKVARENGRPIHAIKILGVNGSKGFGVGLAEDDKRWVVDAINAFFRSRE